MTVRQIWRETAALFWEYPVLWLPVLGADLTSFFLTWLQKYVRTKVIYHLLLGSASVFGQTRSLPGPSSNAPFGKAAMAGGLIQWSMYFTQILLYTLAFFMTAALVRKVSRQKTEFVQTSIQFARSRLRAIFGLSLTLTALLGLLAISLGTLIVFAIMQAQRYMLHPGTEVTYALAMPAFCGIAYFVAPVAMRRIGAGELRSSTVESKKNGRIFAMLAVIASSLLGYFFRYIEGSFAAEPLFRSPAAFTTLSLIVSLIVAFPYVVLFIALTLIVDGEAARDETAAKWAGLSDQGDASVQS